MIKKIKLLIEKEGLFQSIKMLGGLEAFKRIVEKYPELSHYLDEMKGSCSVTTMGPDAHFDFYILDYDIMDEDFVELIVDMEIDFKNLSGDEIYELKQWIGAVADDHGFEIYDVENLPSHQNLFIKSFNGRLYDWPGYEDVISDEEAFELLDKTGLWEGMIREEKSLRDTIQTILKEENENSKNKKVRHAVENLGFDKAVKMFGGYGNLDIIKRAYQDNPLSFLDQFKNLTPVKKGEVMFYVDENNKPLFAYYKDDGRHIVNIDNDRMWEFFGEVLGYDWDEIQSLFKVWLSEVYGLDNTKPLRAYEISNYPRI
jgi:hypothetical protein